MFDIVLESFRAVIVTMIFVTLYYSGQKFEIKTQKGWSLILIGFGLILFGMIIDITDNFPQLDRFVIIGDTEVQSFLEKVIGYLLGFIVLALGFWNWLPVVIKLKETQDSLVQKTTQLQDELAARQQAEAEKAYLENRLVQAQKMEAIGTLAGGIAHDFNNILTIIIGYTDLAKSDAPPDSRYIHDLEKVTNAADRAKDLVLQILTFSRQTQVELSPINIRPLIKEGLKLLRSSIPKTIDINEDISRFSTAVMADPTQVHQILMNLCTNAFHAMEQKGGVLSVVLRPISVEDEDKKMRPHLSPGEYIELTVTDTGVGIGPDVLDRIFDPYFTTKGIGKGTGMGLAIIHGIIKEYGGAVTVESELGEGSAFHVYFPVIEKEALPLVAEPVDLPKGQERILFVDDEEDICDMCKEILQRLGYQVTISHNGINAFEIFENSPEDFDIILTDQTMPGMTGTELSRKILQLRPEMPIILFSGYSSLIDESSAEAIGIKSYILKPLTAAFLSRLIRKIIDEDK